MDFIKDFFYSITQIGIFLAFGLPVLFMIISMFTSGFSKNGLFSWEGRISRKIFIKYFFGTIATMLLIIFISSFFKGTVTTIIGILLMLVCTLFYISAQARRLHDLNATGWIAAIFTVLNMLSNSGIIANVDFNFALSIVNLIFIIILFSIKGKQGINQYGEDPLESLEEHHRSKF